MSDVELKKLRLAHKNMMDRCYNSNNTSFENYGGRGIYVCAEWRDSRETFIEWSHLNGHRIGLTLDRIDVDGPYCPQNCRWISAAQQLRNQRRNRRVTVGGTTLVLVEWAERLGVKASTLQKRLQRMSPDLALQRASLRLGWQHGTRHGYECKGCRCPECKAAHAARHRVMRLRRKLRKEAA